jgi:FtsP/CotA-like multicopper oxidase with cupredoxin domain
MQYGTAWYHSHFSLQCKSSGMVCCTHANIFQIQMALLVGVEINAGRAYYLTYWILGPIVIHGPSSMDYDEDLGPLLIGDWYHADAFSLFWVEILTPHAPLPPSTLINGQGFFDCSPKNDTRCTGTSKRHELSFKKGKKYKLRLANTGSLLTLKFWIDGHKFTVIANDFVPVEPYETDVIIIGIGTFYLSTNSSGANAYMTQHNGTISS